MPGDPGVPGTPGGPAGGNPGTPGETGMPGDATAAGGNTSTSSAAAGVSGPTFAISGCGVGIRAATNSGGSAGLRTFASARSCGLALTILCFVFVSCAAVRWPGERALKSAARLVAPRATGESAANPRFRARGIELAHSASPIATRAVRRPRPLMNLALNEYAPSGISPTSLLRRTA